MALTLAVYLLLPRLLLRVSAAHQLRPLARVLYLHTVSALPAHRQKCVRLLKIERDLRATGIRDHTSIMLILLLLVVLLVELLRQPLLRRLLSKQPANAMTDRQLRHQSDIANGRKLITSAQSLPRTTRSVKRWKSLTAAVQLPHTACRLLRCRVRALKKRLMPAASTMATTHPRPLTIRLRSHLWQLHVHCHACRKHQSKSVQSDRSITNRLLDTWMWMRTMMTKAMMRSPTRPSLSAVALAMRPPTALLLMFPL
jgi:hypothetical protein